MNFSESVAYLYSLGNEVAAMKLGLENIRRLLDALENPHRKYRKVQVAGTNGKGSVCAFLDAICLKADIRTGLYTSPHLVSITERIKFGGVEITEDEFARLAGRVRELSERLVASGEIEYRPTFFEQVTAIALMSFAEADVEIAILETGLGGRLDATTAADAEIAAITRIDYDHQEYLGATLEEIAAEKAAIIRPGSRVVVGKQEEPVMKAILERCRDLGVVPLTVCEPLVSATDLSKHSAVVEFRTNRGTYWDSSLGMAGRHQIENACTAVLIAETLALDLGFPITDEDVWTGLEDARHPGRLEFIGNVLLDGAHNIGGARALRDFLNEFERRPITLVFGAMRGKGVGDIASVLFPMAKNIVLTCPDNARAITVEELAEMTAEHLENRDIILEPRVKGALGRAAKIAEYDGLILVTGSLYLVGEAKRILKSQFEI
ncbi:MAG TPA: folylpolyglutamate synthase/dihydrofolate synthase family protein [Pyrinomonadaceae bacterium]|nr:folylpolyglutamate synthase/dihydrofolate synthase family protein [Pyrinomonadaceae bacterium]